jgi:hypothetical protein
LTALDVNELFSSIIEPNSGEYVVERNSNLPSNLSFMKICVEIFRDFRFKLDLKLISDNGRSRRRFEFPLALREDRAPLVGPLFPSSFHQANVLRK